MRLKKYVLLLNNQNYPPKLYAKNQKPNYALYKTDYTILYATT